MEEFIIAVCLSLVGTALAERVQVDEKDGKMTFNDAILFWDRESRRAKVWVWALKKKRRREREKRV